MHFGSIGIQLHFKLNPVEKYNQHTRLLSQNLGVLFACLLFSMRVWEKLTC